MSGAVPSVEDPGRSLFVQQTAEQQVTRAAAEQATQAFQPLPPPTGPAPYRLTLADALGSDGAAHVRAQTLRFHVIGDSGGVKQPVPQQIVADWMAADVGVSATDPAFAYHVGDVVYYNGELVQYYPQFYEPYEHYGPAILAITGNHDLDRLARTPDPPGAAFARTFCARTVEVLPESQDAPRTTMIQPNVYWTLDAPQVTIVGLATNVPEGGVVQRDQEDWLVGELEAAPADRPLIVALHHPPYSADSHHGGSAGMGRLLDGTFVTARRTPDLILSGHVHNYQRFTRRVQDRDLPYLVCGASGYWHLHAMAEAADGQPIRPPWPVPGSDVTLAAYAADRHGFLRLTAGPGVIEGEYVTVPRPQESWSHGPVQVIDHFKLDTAQHTVTSL